MPEYLSPGVYVEETEMGAKPIEGVSTSTAGFIGIAERGPIIPRMVTSIESFRRLYGGYLSDSFLSYAIEGFFNNGGKRCFISRIVSKNAEDAVIKLPSQAVTTTKTAKKASNTGSGAEKNPPKEVSPKGVKSVLSIQAAGRGVWGNRIAVKIEKAALSTMNPGLFKLTVIYWKEEPPRPAVDPTDPAKSKDPNRRKPSVTEIYDNLSTESTSTDFYEKRINNISSLIEVTQVSQEIPSKTDGLIFLENGSDGNAISLADYKGDAKAGPGERTGLLSLQDVDEISILYAPNENDIAGLTDALIGHCELMRDRFAILQTKQSAGPISTLFPPTVSKYAAYYYPWLKVIDPETGLKKLVPPGGHVAGIYARSDVERGVHKAPANEVVRGVVETQFPVSKTDQDILNPRGVNCIRAFPGRGIRVWGARTISSDPSWKYINVRRLFLYLEESIDEGTQWVVFEPNDEKLWAKVKQTASNFLTRVWKDGALMGTTPDEAFFVKCDRTTMTQDDIDNGRLIIVIGVAPVKPAEFVIFRIAQWSGGSETTE